MLQRTILGLACASVFVSSTAFGDDGPAWCGTRVTTPGTGALVVVDTSTGLVARAALPADVTTFGWSPSCDRVAVVCGKSAGVVDVGTMAYTSYGAPPSPLDISYPGGYGRTSFRPWPHASVAWSRTGAHFVIRARGGNVRNHDALVLYDTATRASQTLALPSGEVDAFAMTSETEVIAVVDTVPVANGERIVVLASAASSRTLAGPYGAAVLGQQDPPVVIATKPTHALVRIDPRTGAETPLATGVRYLTAVSRDGSAALTYVDTGPGAYDYTASSLAIAGGAARVRGTPALDGTNADFSAWARDGSFAVDVARRPGGEVLTWLGPSGATRPIFDPVTVYPAQNVSLTSVAVSLDGANAVFIETHPVKNPPRKAGCDVYGVTELRLGFVHVSGAPAYRALANLGRHETCGIE